MKPKNPKVTVLMPVYNAEKYLREAIESILSQTFKNFEFLIINDGSTDKSKDVILSYNDPRIIYSENSKNLGIAKTLNKGMNLARGNYIARMDGDDISHPDRLQEQIEFMDDNRHVGVCGTWLQTINNNKEEIWKSPIAHEEIRSLMLFHDAIYHPTVVIRRDIIKKHNLRYSESIRYAEDYEFWTRTTKYTRLSNLQEVLLYHRVYHNKHIDAYLKIQEKSADRVRLSQLYKLGIRPDQHEFSIHMAISCWRFKPEKKFVTATKKWLEKLLLSNCRANQYHHDIFAKVIADKWFVTCINAAQLGLWTWTTYWKSSLSKYFSPPLSQKIQLALLCTIKWKPQK